MLRIPQNIINAVKGKTANKPNNEASNSVSVDWTGTYQVDPNNWYKAKPYGFKINLRNNKTMVMFLPISPSNLTINTNFATNVIPTLYGTIEEHSPIRYFDISIEGTTGIASAHPIPSKIVDTKTLNMQGAYNETTGKTRSTFSVAAGVVSSQAAGGFFQRTIETINRISQKANDIVNGPEKPKNAISASSSGYYAFHNLYRALLKYKRDASGVSNQDGNRTNHPLTFFNYKDNNEYDVVVNNFTMRRSADNPMLYFYSIQMRGYNLRTIGENQKISSEYSDRLKKLGLGGVVGSSQLNQAKTLASQARAIVGAVIGGRNILGR
jgi:hypothetical protein